MPVSHQQDTHGGVYRQMKANFFEPMLRDTLSPRTHIVWAQLHNFNTIRFSLGIPLKPLLASLQKILAPAVAKVRANTFPPAELRYARFTLQPFKHNPDLLFSGELAAGIPSNLADNRLGTAVPFGTHGDSFRSCLSYKTVS
jgi:hypothetical protein